jgi:glycosyltransferase involved in cell wall biosynthesis
MYPKVSVIIPTKNRVRYVSSAIKSVLTQTFENFETIVVDAASTDNTAEAVGKFDDERIHYIREDIDEGISVCRNIGIRNSRGAFVAFLDDDDIWMSSKIEKQLALIEKRPSVGAVTTGSWVTNQHGKIVEFGIPSVKGKIFPAILRKNYVGNCSVVLARKECLEKVGMFDESLHAAEDYDLWIRLAKYYEFECAKEYLVVNRMHEISIHTDRQRVLRATKMLQKKYSKELMTLSDRRKILGAWHYNLGVLYSECGNSGQGRKEFVEAVANDPSSIRYNSRLFLSLLGSSVANLLLKSSYQHNTRIILGDS